MLLTLLLMGQLSWGQGLCQKAFSPPTAFATSNLEQVQSRPDLYGQDLWVIQRKTYNKKHLLRKATLETHSWSADTQGVDRPGDPRWGVHYLPAVLKKFFGFEAFDKQGQVSPAFDSKTHYLQIPSPTAVRNLLSVLEKRAQQKDPNFKLIKFYETSGDVLKSREYLKKLAHELELPLAAEGDLFLHDMNFHVFSSFVLPSSTAKALRRRMETLARFDDFVQAQKDPSPEIQLLQKHMEERLLAPMVSYIDLASGNLFGILARRPKTDLPSLMNDLHESVYLLFFEQKSPFEYLRFVLQKTKFDSLQTTPEFKKKFAELLRNFESSLSTDLRQQDFTNAEFLNVGEFYNQSRQQLRALEEAATELLHDQN